MDMYIISLFHYVIKTQDLKGFRKTKKSKVRLSMCIAILISMQCGTEGSVLTEIFSDESILLIYITNRQSRQLMDLTHWDLLSLIQIKRFHTNISMRTLE